MNSFAKFLLVSLLTLLATPAWAQWPVNPSTPLWLADSALGYEYKTVPDGGGGFYYIWVDGHRNSSNEIHGQHVDINGNKLWAAAGKRLSQDKHYYFGLDAVRTAAGQILIAYTEGLHQDTLNTMLLDAAGNQTAFKQVVAGQSIGGNHLYIEEPRLFVRDQHTIISYLIDPDPTNSKKYIYINALRPDLSLIDTSQFGLREDSSLAVRPARFMSYTIEPGPPGKEWLIWCNDAVNNKDLAAQSFRSDSVQFSGPVLTLTRREQGILGFDVVTDDEGGFIVSYYWATDSGKLAAFRIDSTGQQAWARPYHYLQDGVNGAPFWPTLLRQNNHTFVAWADTRPPADDFDIYLQCIDDSGNILGPSNGVLALRYDSYLPVPQLLPADSGDVIVISYMVPSDYDTSMPEGTFARRIRANGTMAWNDARLLEDPSYYLFSANRQEITGNYVFAWADNRGLYLTRLLSQGTVTATSLKTQSSKLTLWPNPAGNRLNYRLPPEASGTVMVLDAQGRKVFEANASTSSLSTQTLPPGLYTLQAGPYRARFSKE